MKHTFNARIKVVVLMLAGIVLSPAHAVFSVTDCSDTIATGVPEIECQAMEALWDSTNGAGWTNNSGWDTNTPIDTWYNIVVNGGQITEILLNQNNLAGTIPPELGDLTDLVDLRLYSNQLVGSIPVEIGNLGSLESLAIYSNQLNGSIQPALGNLSSLTYLDLHTNQLTGSIPATLGNLATLEQLYLQSNALTGAIPKELGNLANLQFLSLDHNLLTGSIPVEFQSLSNLFNLALNANRLSGDIPDLNGNAALIRFYFTENKFVFTDFEPEHLDYKAKLRVYEYNPQDDYVDSPRVISVVSAQALIITPELAENPSGNDQYQWYKGGILIPGPEGTERVFSKTAAITDAGDYTYQVTNTVVTPMMLQSHSGEDAIVVTVDAVASPDYSSVPTTAAGVQFSVVQNGTNPRQDIFISNVGAPGSTLSGQCSELSDPDNVFTLIGTLPWDKQQGDPVPLLIQVMCDSGGTVGLHAGSVQCIHNGDGTTEASPAVYAAECDITATPSYTVGGDVSGLTGSLTLQNNGLDDLLRNADGNFTFAAALADGAIYDVAVSIQPTGQTCSVSNASGIIETADVTDVMVFCVDDNIPVPPEPEQLQSIPTLSFPGLSLLAVLIGLFGIGWRRF